jgi:DNA-binding transcriptional LysR family regulator
MVVAVLDWDDLRYFLALARHGTLSAAAHALSVSQPTMGRRLDALETRMGTKLFLRTPAGHALTAAGSEILRRVENLEREVVGIERVAVGRDAGERGLVRVTTTKWFAAAVLPSILGPLGGGSITSPSCSARSPA